MTSRHTEIAKHLRHLIRQRDGIKARVRVAPGGGSVQVFPPSHEAEFTTEEQRQIAFIAKCNRLTFVRGMEIKVEQDTYAKGFDFYLGA